MSQSPGRVRCTCTRRPRASTTVTFICARFAEGRMVVTQGLQAGERVVTDGQLSLGDDTLVRIADGQ
jgi:hypothetical protein